MERVALIEPVPIEDDLVTALSHVEEVGGWGGRLVFYHRQTCAETGAAIFVVKRKLVIDLAGLRVGHPIVRSFIENMRSPLRQVK
jgi:hypothetical protein